MTAPANGGGGEVPGVEMGCQGEVGVGCSIGAGALTALLGGSNERVENAAEFGMEHNLGLTCDLIQGLVQIPCIERNRMGAVKAINAAYLALRGEGTRIVPLDTVIETVRQSGQDMRSKDKETSLGGPERLELGRKRSALSDRADSCAPGSLRNSGQARSALAVNFVQC